MAGIHFNGASLTGIFYCRRWRKSSYLVVTILKIHHPCLCIGGKILRSIRMQGYSILFWILSFKLSRLCKNNNGQTNCNRSRKMWKTSGPNTNAPYMRACNRKTTRKRKLVNLAVSISLPRITSLFLKIHPYL